MIDGVSALDLDAALPIRGESLGLILFGSHARGDASADSDIDILQVVPRHRPSYRDGAYCFSAYTKKHLQRMAVAGSLFVRHLVREAVGMDVGGTETLDRLRLLYRAPSDHEQILEDVRQASALLDVPPETYGRIWNRLHQLAAHLVRTALYARAHDSGCDTFSLNRVQEFFQDDEIGISLQIRRANSVVPGQYERALRLLDRYSGGRRRNGYGSVEALVVNSLGTSALTVILGLRLLNETGEVLPYEDLAAAGECISWAA